MDTPHLLIIDDHAMFRTGLRMVLSASMEKAGVQEAGSLEEALRSEGATPDLVLLDVKLPGLNGVEGIGLLKRKWPTAPVLILSSLDEPETMRLALTRGAIGFISKADTAEKIVAVVEHILRGESLASADQGDGDEAGDSPAPLTPRQCEVLDLLCQGLSNKLIARRLNLSEHTVRGHVQGILRFLQVSSRSEATFAARQRGLVA
jgi:DNA-binding NarL/FixJ family response regulator